MYYITIDAETDGPKDIVKALKGTTRRKLLKEFPSLKKRYFWGNRFWSLSIYFDSLGERTITDMNIHTRNQRQPRNLKKSWTTPS
jgi:putative transposase